MRYILAVLLITANCLAEDKNEKQFAARPQTGRQLGFDGPGPYGLGGGQAFPEDGQGYAASQQAYPGLRGYPQQQGFPGAPGYPGPQGYPGQQSLYPGQQPGYPGDFQFDPYAAQQPQYPVPQYGGYYPQQHPQQQGIPGQPPQAYYPGQPFLLNPAGGGPPNNFLYPQQPGAHPQQPGAGGGVDPNIFRNNPFPQTPVFGPGYPRPAHIPPIEKDAEEIPTNPKQIPQMRPPSAGKKPQKIELDDDESEPSKESAKPGTPSRPANTPIRNLLNLRPGQRFFILNGQPLFSNYAQGALNPFQTERFNQQPILFRQNPLYQQQQQQQPAYNRQAALQNYFLRNGPITNFNKLLETEIKEEPQYAALDKPIDDSPPGVLLRDSLPFVLHDQVVGKDIEPEVVLRDEDLHQSRYYEKGLPEEQNVQQEEPIASLYAGNVRPGIAYDYYRYNDNNNNNDDDNEAVVIDAKVQDVLEDDNDTEDVEAATERAVGSSVAQAQPGAIALAGPGGVAAAGPRGTALAGEGGLAVSSPQATAVAGPSRDDDVPEKKTKAKKQKTN